MRKIFRFHVGYKLIVGSLTMIALVMAGGFLTISYIYRLQDTTDKIIQENIKSVDAARELQMALYNMRIISLNYVIDKDSAWMSLLREREDEFTRALERAKESTNTAEESNLLQQISALFSNFTQNLNTAVVQLRQGSITKAHRLLVLGSRDLINTIEEKCNAFITSNENEQAIYEENIRRNNEIIRTSINALGIGGTILGLVLGWLIARIILNPIYKLVLKVRGASGSELVEHIKMTPGKELEELDLHINRMISRINKAHDDLEKNRQLLERSTKLAAIGRIAPAIAHEIRNPLAAIKMLIFSMKSEPDINKEKQQDLDIIVKEIDRMEGFLQNFLKYARPAKPQMQNVSVVPVIRETIQLMAPKLRQNNIDVIENFQQESLEIMADTGQLKQVLINLMLNAIDSMNKGGRLTLSTQIDKPGDQQDPKPFLQIRISDTGYGISDEIKESLFDPFVKGTDQGIGLGLSISQRIAELHHGWIEADNNPEKGATFTIHLPVD
jgi:signal transduction histidine kinase